MPYGSLSCTHASDLLAKHALVSIEKGHRVYYMQKEHHHDSSSILWFIRHPHPLMPPEGAGFSLTIYAVQRWGLICRYDFYDLSAVRFVYRYVI